MSKENHLRFSSQNLPEVEDVSEALIERAYDDRQVGMYAHLSISEEVFIQAGSRASPSTCCGPADDPLVKELKDDARPWNPGSRCYASGLRSLFILRTASALARCFVVMAIASIWTSEAARRIESPVAPRV